MLIDKSYFFGDISIGQLSEQSVQDSLELFIKQYEPELLTRLLGYETYKQIGDNDQKWKDLKEGTEYTNYDGKAAKWNGLYDNTTKISVIAYYVYCQYMENQLTATGGAGEGKVQMQNAIAVTNGRKIRKAWNLMVKQNWQLVRYLYSRRDVYTEWAETFDDAKLDNELFEYANQFGI